MSKYQLIPTFDIPTGGVPMISKSGPDPISSRAPLKLRALIATALFCVTSVLFSETVVADLTIDLEDAATAAQFDGDGIGDQAGPFAIDGVPVTFLTLSVSGAVATDSFGLGLNSGVADTDTQSFNISENWTIVADESLFFTGIELGGLQSEETFSIQSNQWINLSGIVSGAGVTYTAATGTFTLTDGPANDVFTEAELTGGVALSVFAGHSITFGNLTSTFGPNDDVELENFTFRHNPIPEPASGFVFAFAGLAVALRRKR